MLRALAIVLFIGSTAFAHGGRTDSKGGHHDRKNGGYHYHNSGHITPPPVREPVIDSPSRTNMRIQPRVEVRTSPRATARTSAPSNAAIYSNSVPDFQFSIVREQTAGGVFTAVIRVSFTILTPELEIQLSDVPRRMTQNPSYTIFVIHVNDPPTAEPILRIRTLKGQFVVQPMSRYNSFVKNPPKQQVIDTKDLFADEKPIRWFYQAEGKDVGPVTATELFALCDQDVILPSTLVRRSVGEPFGWIPASEVDGMLTKPSSDDVTFVADLDREALAKY